jgi:hypothetical protein
VLVVGSEGFGISGQLRRRLDQTVRIPMRGKVASLNAAVAGSVLLFAAAEQRGDTSPAPEAVGPGQSDGADEPADPAAAAADASPAAPANPSTADGPATADLLPDDTPAPRPRRSRTRPTA